MSSSDKKKTLSSSSLSSSSNYFVDNNKIEKKKSNKLILAAPSPRVGFMNINTINESIRPSILTENMCSSGSDCIVMLVPPDSILLEFILKKYVRSPIMTLNTETDELVCANKSVKSLIQKDKQNKDKIIKSFKENIAETIDENKKTYCIGKSIYLADAFTMLQICGFEDGKDFKGFKHYLKQYIEKHGIKRNGEFYVPFNQFEQEETIAEFIGKLKSNEKEELVKRNKALEEVKYVTYSDLHAFDYEQYMKEQRNRMQKQVYIREDSESLCFVLSQIYDRDGIDFAFNPETAFYCCTRSNYGKFLVNLKRIKGFSTKILYLVGTCITYDIPFVIEKGKDLHTSVSGLVLAQQVALDCNIDKSQFLKLSVTARGKLYNDNFPFCNVEIVDDKEIHLEKMNWLPTAYDLVPDEFRKFIIHEKSSSHNNPNNSSSSSSNSSNKSLLNSKKIRYYMVQENEYQIYKSMFSRNMKRDPEDFVKQTI